MIKQVLIYLSLIAVLSLQGCSWVVRFLIVNNTSDPVHVEITLSDQTGIFPIFHYKDFSLFSVDSKDNINIEQREDAVFDTLNTYHTISVLIPAFKALEIGRINNQEYEKYNQEFINSRYFNLQKLLITSQNDTVKINDHQFDEYFSRREKNNVMYDLHEK